MISGCDGCAAHGAGASDPRFRRVLWAALVANAVMFVVELVAAALSGSVSLQADALDFFGDSVNYVVTLLVLGMSLRARARAALFKSATMALFGVWVLASAALRALAGTPPDAAVMGAVGVLALLVNVTVALALFRFRNGDSNARSIWLCSRNDALANIGVMLAAAGVVATGSVWPDIVVAALIAGLNLSAALHVLRRALGELRSEPGGRLRIGHRGV